MGGHPDPCVARGAGSVTRFRSRPRRGGHPEPSQHRDGASLCSTVNYFTGRPGVATLAETQTPNPYNTYLNLGLPPGPIASPGEASIDAAISPAQNDYLFFVTVDLITGETRYATTYTEHLQNVEILGQWMAR